MAAGQYNFDIEQGVAFARIMNLKDANGDTMNLTGYSARMQIRPYVSSDEVLIEATTANSKLIITPLTGVLTLSLSAADTGLLVYTKSVYDIELINSAGIPVRLLQGEINVSREVTR